MKNKSILLVFWISWMTPADKGKVSFIDISRIVLTGVTRVRTCVTPARWGRRCGGGGWRPGDWPGGGRSGGQRWGWWSHEAQPLLHLAAGLWPGLHLCASSGEDLIISFKKVVFKLFGKTVTFRTLALSVSAFKATFRIHRYLESLMLIFQLTN